MTQHFMLRSFDHAGYYETRVLLMLMALGVALFFQVRRHDPRYLIMFASGVFWQGIMEWLLQSFGLRGANYNFSVFGVTLSGLPGNLFQGCAEGGILSVMAFWFFDLRTARPLDRCSLRAYLWMCVAIVILASVVGMLAAGKPITSPRPMTAGVSLIRLGAIILGSVALAAWKRGLLYLWLFYAGLLIYVVITFEPLHVLGARYIGVRTEGGELVAASWAGQILWMLYSHVVEVAGGKVHYFAVPFALGWVPVGSRRAA